MGKQGFLHINKVIMPLDCIKKAYEHMRRAGQVYVEGVALFAGKEQGSIFTITETIIPEQEALRLEEGLLYLVDGDELHRINVWLYEHGLSIMVQIHSHPRDAYHSATDDTYPIVATVGGLSIVVPDFARGPIEIDTWAVYRLMPNGDWIDLSVSGVPNLIELRDNGFS